MGDGVAQDGGSTGRTQGMPAGGVNERRAMAGFGLGEGGGEEGEGGGFGCADGKPAEDAAPNMGASIGVRVSCGDLGGEWESARMYVTDSPGVFESKRVR